MRLLLVFSLILAEVVVMMAVPSANAQTAKAMTPTETVVAFYSLLRDHKYREGMALSVFNDAVAPLSDEDLVELEPDFQRTFSAIPAKLDIAGEQVSGEVATVFVRFSSDSPDADSVGLVRDAGHWLVGDAETMATVRDLGPSYFFTVRINVNHNEVFDLVRRIAGSEDVYFRRTKTYATLAELIASEGLTDDLTNGDASGYKFTVNLTADRSSFTVIAIPIKYGRTGKLSFFADTKGIHGADSRGLPVNEQSPILTETNFEKPPEP